METLETLRQLNLISSFLAVGITGYLVFRIYLRYLSVRTVIEKRVTGAALLGVAALFFINSVLLLTTFISIAVAYDPEFINLFSNLRVLLVNTITIAISILILMIERGRL